MLGRNKTRLSSTSDLQNASILQFMNPEKNSNDRFSCRMAALEFTLTRHFSRCERVQRKNQIHTMGSSVAFAAIFTNGWFCWP